MSMLHLFLFRVAVWGSPQAPGVPNIAHPCSAGMPHWAPVVPRQQTTSYYTIASDADDVQMYILYFYSRSSSPRHRRKYSSSV